MQIKHASNTNLNAVITGNYIYATFDGLYTADSIEVGTGKRSNTSAKSLLGVAIKNTQTELSLVSRDS